MNKIQILLLLLTQVFAKELTERYSAVGIVFYYLFILVLVILFCIFLGWITCRKMKRKLYLGRLENLIKCTFHSTYAEVMDDDIFSISYSNYSALIPPSEDTEEKQNENELRNKSNLKISLLGYKDYSEKNEDNENEENETENTENQSLKQSIKQNMKMSMKKSNIRKMNKSITSMQNRNIHSSTKNNEVEDES